MTSVGGLLEKARQGPANFAFGDLCRLVEAAGYSRARSRGSHRIYVHEYRSELPIINLQRDRSGKAKPYQVHQVLRLIDEQGLLEE